MNIVQRKLSRTFKEFIGSSKSAGIVLVVCTSISLVITNSPFRAGYVGVWQSYIGGMSVEHWVNDLLMAIFFLLIGLELERELISGELSNFKNALLPIFAAVGGLATPALIHYLLNAGTPAQAGLGIPMATDIAFALGVLALLGSRVPASLKVFLTAVAVMDDLAAIIVIALFYTAELAAGYLLGAGMVFGILMLLKRAQVFWLAPYLIGGLVMWYLMLKSGVHATIAGVALAFAIPFSSKQAGEESPSQRLEHFLHKPVAFIILPIFALANTAIVIGSDWAEELTTANSLGIIGGLVIGKPLGVLLLSFAAVALGISRLPLDLNWKHIIGAGFLGGIGFTMSIFITNLAFVSNFQAVNASKIAVLLASMVAGVAGFLWLKLLGQPDRSDKDMDTVDYDLAD